MGPAAALGAGLAAGLMHVASGPDHFAAVLPLSVGPRWKRSAAVGAAWGIGHGLGVVGLVIVGQVARPWLDPERLSSLSELLVGVLLVALGVTTLHRARGLFAHGHEHLEPVGFGATAVRSSVVFGVLHGIGGTGHLLAVLPTLAFGPGGAAVYLAGYLVAAVAWMSGVAGVAGLGLSDPRRVRVAFGTAGLLAVAVGLYWMGAAVGAA